MFLFAVTVVELGLLFYLTSTFWIEDWIYLAGHLVVLVIALTRPVPERQDISFTSSIAVFVAYAYPYAQVAYLRWKPGTALWPEAGLVLIIFGACLSFGSLLCLGRGFGVWPAFRGLAASGPYRLVRHPMYLAYVVSDIGYNFCEYDFVTVLLVIVGWAALLYRIRAEERVLSRNAGWLSYAARVRYRLMPGIW